MDLIASGNWNDVAIEERFDTLNRRGFVRGNSAEHAWYLLINEACTQANIPVNDLQREYLGTMLNRFMTRAELFEQFKAFSYYEHVLGADTIDPICVQDAADISLQYVAFFPERTACRHEPRSLNGIADIGASLYRELARESKEKDDWFSRAFRVMAESFGSAVIVLRSAYPKLQSRDASAPALKDAVLFPSDKDLPVLTRAIERFGQMYLRQSRS